MNSKTSIPFAQKKLYPNWLALRLDANGSKTVISTCASPDSESNIISMATFDEVMGFINSGQAIEARYQYSDGSFEDFDKALLLAHYETLGLVPATGNDLMNFSTLAPLNTQQIQWEQAIPLSNISTLPFPDTSLPDVLRNFVLAVAESTQTPVDMAGMAVLTVCALCLQGEYKVQATQEWSEPLNLYTVIVMEPAERKSAVMKLCTKSVTTYERNDYVRRKESIEKNKTQKRVLQKEVETLINIVAKNPSRQQDLLDKQDKLTNFVGEKQLRLVTDDTTPEALATLLTENDGKMGIVSAEGGLFETFQGRYSNGINIDTLLKAHSGDEVRIDRRGRDSEVIPDPCLTILLSIQSQVLEGLIDNAAFRGKGLTARFLYSLPISNVGRRKINPKSIPQNYLDDYERLITFLLSQRQSNQNALPLTMILSSDATVLFDNYRLYIEKELNGSLEHIADWGGKLCGAVLRIAGIIHAVENYGIQLSQNPISKDTIGKAISLGEYLSSHAQAAYQLLGSDKRREDAKYILRQLEKQPEREFKRKYDIHRHCRSKIKSVDKMMPGLELLEELNYLKILLRSGSKEFNVILNPLHFGS